MIVVPQLRAQLQVQSQFQVQPLVQPQLQVQPQFQVLVPPQQLAARLPGQLVPPNQFQQWALRWRLSRLAHPRRK